MVFFSILYGSLSPLEPVLETPSPKGDSGPDGGPLPPGLPLPPFLERELDEDDDGPLPGGD